MSSFFKITLFVLILPFFIQAKGQKQFIDPRDNQSYSTVELGELVWFQGNLLYITINSLNVKDSLHIEGLNCGLFYPVEESKEVSPSDGDSRLRKRS